MELRRRGWEHLPCSRAEVDYTRFEVLRELLRNGRPTFLINAAGYTGKPNVDACEEHKADTLAGNTLFPLTVAHACAEAENARAHGRQRILDEWNYERQFDPVLELVESAPPSVLL